MTRAISLQTLKPIYDRFDPGDTIWPVVVQAVADTVYAGLGAKADSLTAGQYNALVDLAYSATFAAVNGSAIWRLILAGNLAMATYEFEKWVYGPDPVTGQPTVLADLVARRAANKAIWLS